MDITDDASETNAATARRRAPTRRLKATPLSEDDWVEAATDILVDETVRGIRIDALCKRLGVTKGSFYWHFRGRTHLLTALLARWRKRMTTNVIDRLTALGGRPKERLRALLVLPGRPNSPPFARVEQSIRDWSRRDDQARHAVKEVDEVRLTFFKDLLIAQGLSDAVAERRAYIAYAIMMGDSVLRQSLDADAMADEWIDEVMSLLTRPDVDRV